MLLQNRGFEVKLSYQEKRFLLFCVRCSRLMNAVFLEGVQRFEFRLSCTRSVLEGKAEFLIMARM